MARQADRSAAMRERLIAVGLKAFAEHGYEGTSTNALLSEAGVSKGALYHHFASKQALFEAVFEYVARTSIARALASAPRRPETTELDRLIDGALHWLREARRPAVSKILLEEGPRVLGFQRARQLEAKSSLGLMIAGLERAQHAGEIDVEDIQFSARLINAALGEAALVRATERRPPSQAKVDAMIRKLIEGLTQD